MANEPRADTCVAAAFGEGAAGKLGLDNGRGAAAAFAGAVAETSVTRPST